MNPTTHIQPLPKLLAANPYPGRGLAIGYTPDGKHAVIAYFIMGRSANSRNRIFEEVDGDLYTRAFDESKVEDPSLIIYAPLRVHEAPERYSLIATNGDRRTRCTTRWRRVARSNRRLRRAASAGRSITAQDQRSAADSRYRRERLPPQHPQSVDAEGSAAAAAVPLSSSREPVA